MPFIKHADHNFVGYEMLLCTCKKFYYIYFKTLFFHCYNLGQKESLGISSFGVSVTTMEEVFTKVGELGEKPEDIDEAMRERHVIYD